MKLIIGLGNPGKEYENTRHNIGFQIIDQLEKTLNSDIKKTKMMSEYSTLQKDGETIIFLKPLTYMNLSGHSVKNIMDYFKIKIEDIIVIYDDIDLELGTIRLRQEGASAGHNGIKSIIKTLESTKFKRIRFGVGKDKSYNTSDWVLSKFKSEEKPIVKQAILKVIDIIENFLKNFDFQEATHTFNETNKKTKEV